MFHTTTKQSTINMFKKYFNCQFDINISDNEITVITSDLPLGVQIEFKNNQEKKQIYSFLMYLALSFDFSYTLEFYEMKDLIF